MAMQDRLRQLGATYYLLETWGNQRQFYRFYCQMAVGGNSSYTHYFEATNTIRWSNGGRFASNRVLARGRRCSPIILYGLIVNRGEKEKGKAGKRKFLLFFPFLPFSFFLLYTMIY